MKKVFGILIVLVFAIAMSSCSNNTEPIETAIDSTIVAIDTTSVVIAPVVIDTCKVVKP
jgi:PBP1b-binding outer membrane lipoprotein LpoB